jgi:hypothetical protein
MIPNIFLLLKLPLCLDKSLVIAYFNRDNQNLILSHVSFDPAAEQVN